MAISIFDITLITDITCNYLPLSDIHRCRQVNSQWAALFHPHLWKIVNVLWIVAPTGKSMSIIDQHKTWIQSLTACTSHIERLSQMGFQNLQELILHDNLCQASNSPAPAKVCDILTLINQNQSLRNLNINLKRENYDSKKLAPSLLLAIARHPTLTKLTWEVPELLYSEEFVQSLLHVCRKSIQELHVGSRPYISCPCRMCDGRPCYYFADSFRPFTFADFAGQDDGPEYQELARNLASNTPTDPFALKKFYWMDDMFQKQLLWPFRNSPELEEVNVNIHTSFNEQYRQEMLDILSSSVTLKDVSFEWSTTRPAEALVVFKQFTQLRKLELPCSRWAPVDTFEELFSHMVDSSYETLEVVELNMINQQVARAVRIITTFPNLKEINIGLLKIRIQDKGDAESAAVCVQTLDELQSLKVVVSEWEMTGLNYDEGVDQWRTRLCVWWTHWLEAQKTMRALWKMYTQLGQTCRLLPIDMRFMLPIQPFMSVKQRERWQRGPKTIRLLNRMATIVTTTTTTATYDFAKVNNQDLRMYDDDIPEDLERDFNLSKSRNRHHTLRDKKRSQFQRPFKK